MANFLKKLLLGIFERPMPPLTAADAGYADDLRRAIDEHVQALSDAPSESERTWHLFNEELRACVHERDPREFLQWSVIRKSMFVSNPSYVAAEWRYLKGLPDWKSRWRAAIDETPIGRPRPYPRYPRSSGNLIHHAYHVARFENETGVRVDTLKQVFEFGGGYGSMARLFFQLGFKGRYVIFDFPYFSALQRFFLRSIGMQADLDDACTAQASSEQGAGRICCLSDGELLRATLAADSPAGGRLYLATWSISETPLSVREQIMPQVRDYDYFLIAFQHQFEEIDNRAYFHDWAESMGSGYQWTLLPIEHLPGNSYLFGRRSG